MSFTGAAKLQLNLSSYHFFLLLDSQVCCSGCGLDMQKTTCYGLAQGGGGTNSTSNCPKGWLPQGPLTHFTRSILHLLLMSLKNLGWAMLQLGQGLSPSKSKHFLQKSLPHSSCCLGSPATSRQIKHFNASSGSEMNMNILDDILDTSCAPRITPFTPRLTETLYQSGYSPNSQAS